eukprot:Nk52_evm74s914 gene=Nk52_evmTU74s914
MPPVVLSEVDTQHNHIPLYDVLSHIDLEKEALQRDCGVVHVHDRIVKGNVYKITGSSPSTSYVQFPKAQCQSLSLQRRFLYILFKTCGSKFFAFHIDVLSESGIEGRISISNVYKQAQCIVANVQIPFAKQNTKWSLLGIDIESTVESYLGWHYQCIKNIRICANVNVSRIYNTAFKLTGEHFGKEALKNPSQGSKLNLDVECIFFPEENTVLSFHNLHNVSVQKGLKPNSTNSSPMKSIARREKSMSKLQTPKGSCKKRLPDSASLEPVGAGYLELVELKNPHIESCNDVHYMSANQIIFCSGRNLICMDTNSLQQKIFIGHSGFVDGLSVEMESDWFASYQQGFGSEIRLWNRNVNMSSTTVCSGMDYVSCIAVSLDEQVMFCAGLRKNHKRIVSIFDISGIADELSGRVICSTQTHVEDIAKAIFVTGPTNRFITCGKGNVRMWKLKNELLSSVPFHVDGSKNHNFLEMCLSENESQNSLLFVTSSLGLVFIFSFDLLAPISIFSIHNGAICGICRTENNIVTGDECGLIRVWNSSLSECLFEIDAEEPVACVRGLESSSEFCFKTHSGSLFIVDTKTKEVRFLLERTSGLQHGISVFETMGLYGGLENGESIGLWDINAGKKVSSIRNNTEVTCLGPILNDRLVYLEEGKRLCTIDIKTLKSDKVLYESVSSIIFFDAKTDDSEENTLVVSTTSFIELVSASGDSFRTPKRIKWNADPAVFDVLIYNRSDCILALSVEEKCVILKSVSIFEERRIEMPYTQDTLPICGHSKTLGFFIVSAIIEQRSAFLLLDPVCGVVTKTIFLPDSKIPANICAGHGEQPFIAYTHGTNIHVLVLDDFLEIISEQKFIGSSTDILSLSYLGNSKTLISFDGSTCQWAINGLNDYGPVVKVSNNEDRELLSVAHDSVEHNCEDSRNILDIYNGSDQSTISKPSMTIEEACTTSDESHIQDENQINSAFKLVRKHVYENAKCNIGVSSSLLQAPVPTESSVEHTRLYIASPGEEGIHISRTFGFGGELKGPFLWLKSSQLLLYPVGFDIVCQRLSEDGNCTTLIEHDGQVTALAHSFEEKLFASSSSCLNKYGEVKSRVLIWSTPSLEMIIRIENGPRVVQALDFSNCETYLAIVGNNLDPTIALFEVKSGSCIKRISTSNGMNVCAWALVREDIGDAELLCTGGLGHLTLWKVQSSAKIFSMSLASAGFEAYEYTTACILSENLILCGTVCGKIIKCEMTSSCQNYVIGIVPGEVINLCYSRENSELSCISSAGVVLIFRVNECFNSVDLSERAVFNRSIKRAVIDIKSKMGLFSTFSDGMEWFDVVTESTLTVASGWTEPLQNMDVSSNDSFIALCFGKGKIELRTSNSNVPLCNIAEHLKNVTVVKFCNRMNENLLLCGCADGMIYSFDIGKFEEKESWLAHDAGVVCLELPFSKPVLISGHEDGQIFLHNFFSGKLLAVISDHANANICNISCPLQVDGICNTLNNRYVELSVSSLWLASSCDSRISVWGTDWVSGETKLVDWISFAQVPEPAILDREGAKTCPPTLAEFVPLDPFHIVFTGPTFDITIQIYSLREQGVVRKFCVPDRIFSMSLSPCSNVVLTANNVGLVRLVDIDCGNFQDFPSHNAPLTCVRYAPSGNDVYTCEPFKIHKWASLVPPLSPPIKTNEDEYLNPELP